MSAVLALALGVTAFAVPPAEDVNQPILPGWGQYYWNVNACWYIHAPRFNFKPIAGATQYRNRVIVNDKILTTFTASTSKTDLSQVWAQVPEKSVVRLECDGLNAKGDLLNRTASVTFWKNAPFKEGSYPPAVRSYGEAASRAYDYIFKLPALKKLTETGQPDFSYAHNCYPSKMNASIINAAVGAAENDPSKKEAMLKIARAAADYLIATVESADAPLAHFTQTYRKGSDQLAAKQYQGQHMLIYPAEAAYAFVRLYRLSKDKKYLEAAKHIAGTYLKLQGEDGTWYLKMWAKDGTRVNPNRLFPMPVCDLLTALAKETGKEAYGQAADRAFTFIEKGPLADWNWEGQFEDGDPSDRCYKNLTKHSAVDTAMYLLKRYSGDKARIAQARALMEFAEDQFVAWEQPCRADGVSYPVQQGEQAVTNWWCCPTVMEQYAWYVPTDASVAKMIRGYLAIYRATKNPTDLAKAKALGDAFTRAQRDSGRIPTQWMGGWFKTSPASDWINCMIASASALAQLSAETLKPKHLRAIPPGDNNPRNSEGDFAVLKDGRIVYTYSRYTAKSGEDNAPACLASIYSSDGGKTWTPQYEVAVLPEGALNVMSVSYLRLKDGSLALFYLKKFTAQDCRPMMRVSKDEGKTWSAETRCIPDAEKGYYVLNNCRVERLKSGRILLPLWQEGKDRLGCYYSDDDGATWTRGAFAEVFDAAGKHVCVQEPGAVELKDGRVLMYARTDRGRQWYFHSADGGKTFDKGEPSPLWGPLSPATVKRLKNGDLVALWNDHENRPDLAKAGPSWAHGVRTPLTLAISKDEGRTWPIRRTLLDDRQGWYCYAAILERDHELLLGVGTAWALSWSHIYAVPLD